MQAELLSDNAAHLLVVDDDTRIRDLLNRYLSDQGFRVTTASDAAEARRKLNGLEFDLLVVDVMMPGETGVALTKWLRELRDVPILMLTALAEINSRLEGLEAGADDYLAKPFDPRELVLRINNILKRGGPPEIPQIEQIVFGPYTFGLARRELKRGAEIVRLTDREQEIMVQFAQRPGERSQGTNWSVRISISANARSTCRSTVCGARSRKIPPIPCGSRRCAVSATG